MGKETKIGLAIIGSLLVVLVVVLVKKMSGPSTAGLDETLGADAKPKTTAAAPELPKPSQPTLLKTNTSKTAPPVPSAGSSRWQTAGQGATDPLKSQNAASSPLPEPSSRTAQRPVSGDRYGSRFRVEVADPTGDDAAPFNPFANQPPEPGDGPSLHPPRRLTPGESTVQVIDGPAQSPQPDRGYGDHRGAGRQTGATSGGQRVHVSDPAPAASPYEHRSQSPPVAQRPYGQHTGLGGSDTRQSSIPARSVSDPYHRPASPHQHDIYQHGHQPQQQFDGPTAENQRPVSMRENTGKYHVEPGDTFWTISQKMYGEGGFFKALQEHNRGRIPVASQLDVGDEISTPSADELRSKYSGLCPKVRTVKPGTPSATAVSTRILPSGREYTVEEGDTLFDIAKYELGDPSRWPEIFQLNRHVLGDDIDYVRPGTRLMLPGDRQNAQQPADVLTRQPRPSPNFQR